MKRKRTILIALAVLAAAALIWLAATYHVVDFKLYRRDTTQLDLRGQDISASHYEKLKAKLPDAQIRWDVPFQGGALADDTTEVTVTALSQEDAQILAKYLPRLRKVNAEECADYDSLLSLKRQRPGVQVNYRVKINGVSYASDAVKLTLSGIGKEELGQLAYLYNLKTVEVTGGEGAALAALHAQCQESGIAFQIRIGGDIVSETVRTLAVDGVEEEELGLFTLLPGLKTLHLTQPEASARSLLELRETLSGAAVTWEKDILGLTFSDDATEIDLTDVISLGEGEKLGDKTAYQHGLEYPVQGTQEEIPTAIKISKYHPIPDKTEDTGELIAQVEAAMAYFPEAQTLILQGSVLDNEAMSAFREAHREDYKVVWSVQCGYVLTRTDAEFFMPVKYHVYYLSDEEAYNLRYCEDIVALDIGHMAVSDISFVEFMPKLEYLILAHTSIRYIEPIRTCKNLKFLEVDWTAIQDFSPLLDCTGLQDLNIGLTPANIAPIRKMTWLKNLWMIFRKDEAYVTSQALPDTKVVCGGSATVDSGWRDLPNYYAMRDCLKMYYMSW